MLKTLICAPFVLKSVNLHPFVANFKYFSQIFKNVKNNLNNVKNSQILLKIGEKHVKKAKIRLK